MYLSTAGQTLTGQQNASYTTLKANALTINGNAVVSGIAALSSLGGTCITDSLILSSSSTAASAAGLSNVYSHLGSALQTSGGNITGNLAVSGNLFASNFSVLGSFETINAYETHSSNVTIANLGTGPALTVSQIETTAQPVASFVAGSTPALYS